MGTTQWVNSRTDQELLRDYSGCQSEDAFAELVRRHVDFVYSVAVRLVRDTHLAEDVTQGVFVALSQNAQPLIDCTVLAGWLHRTTRNIAAKAIRSDARSRVRAQEAAAMNVVISAATDSPWEHLAPHLDAALAELTESDRDILLLRYFQKRDFQTVGRTLGVTDDTAQKRVSRAVERLRESLAKRGITIGASGLIVVISANAVQVAPVGLTVTISSAVALAGTTIVTTATTTASKALAMTSLQKTVIGATLVAAISVGI